MENNHLNAKDMPYRVRQNVHYLARIRARIVAGVQSADLTPEHADALKRQIRPMADLPTAAD